MAAMMLPLSTVAPSIAERVGFRRTLVIGTLTMAVGLVTLAFMADTDGGFASVLPATLILGAGVGLTMSPSTAAITSSLPDEKQGVAASLNDTVRSEEPTSELQSLMRIPYAGFRLQQKTSTTHIETDST